MVIRNLIICAILQILVILNQEEIVEHVVSMGDVRNVYQILVDI